MNWINKMIEPKKVITKERQLFTTKMLLAIGLPLLGEQFFMMLVGVADTLMISYAGEEAVSGVSLVNMFVTIFLFVFTSLGSGGAVIVSQYIGKQDFTNGRKAAGQLVQIAIVVSVTAFVLVVIFNQKILGFLFGSVDQGVMDSSIVYLRITAYSLPSIAIYNAGAAIFRSMGKTKTILYLSLISNILNVIGNAIGIFILKAGVAGVAWPSLIARTLSATVIIILCFNTKNNISLSLKSIFITKKKMIKRILNIAVPSSIEGGIFQLAKVALGTITAMFGTVQIAANGIAQSFWSMAALVSMAMGPVFITVIGQTMGKGDHEAAEYYMIKLLKISYLASITWNGFILLMTPLALTLYDVSNETKQIIIILVLIHNLFNAIVFPVASPFANGLRAAGDAKYTMLVAVSSTVLGRVVLSLIFALVLNLGVFGIAIAMVLDWTIRAIFYVKRYQSKKWQLFKVI